MIPLLHEALLPIYRAFIWDLALSKQMPRAPGLLVLLATCVYAQPALTLADAIAEAQANHPRLQVAEGRIAAAEALRTQASLGLNPRLFLQSENTRFGGSPPFSYPSDTDNFAYLSQVFERGGKRARRIELASADVRVSAVDRAVLNRQIAGRISLAYWSASAAASLLDLLRQDVETYEGIVRYHRDRVREGAMAEVDLLRVLLERDRLTVSVQTATQDYTQAILTLSREMGRAASSPITLSDKISQPTELPAPDYTAILVARPEIEAASASVERARVNLRLQQSYGTPDPEVLLGYKRTAGLNTLIGGFQINLPVRNRNQGQIGAAAALIRVAENERRVVESQIRAEVESAWSAYQARRALLANTLGPMQERANEIARISLAAYREGGMDILRLIDAQRTRLEALTMYYRTLSDYQTSVTALQIATGAPL